jgi:hypothetical protein
MDIMILVWTNLLTLALDYMIVKEGKEEQVRSNVQGGGRAHK